MPRRKKKSETPAATPVVKESAAKLMKTVRQQTRTKYGAEDKIRIILRRTAGRSSRGRAVPAGGDHLTLTVHASPEAFDRALEAFLQWYRYEHYHEGIGNLHPADVYFGRAEAILAQRKSLKEKTKKARKKANLLKPKNRERASTYAPIPSMNLKPKVSHLF